MGIFIRHRMHQSSLVTVFEGTSIDALSKAGQHTVRDGALRPGAPFVIEMGLRFPLAGILSSSLAEQFIWSKRMPPGIDFINAEKISSTELRVNGTVVAAESSKSLFRTPVLVVAVVGWLAVNWLRLSLVAIGVAAALGFLVNAIRGKSLVEGIIGSGLGTLVPILLLGLALVLVLKSKPGKTRDNT